MPTLTETLSALLAQATRARVEADRETARIALLYQQDELLRTMPVPRFRLPTLTVELPAAVTGVAPPPPTYVEVLPRDVFDRWRDQVFERWVTELNASGFELIDRDGLAAPLAREAERWSAIRVAPTYATVRDAVVAVLAAWPGSPDATRPVILDDRLPALRTALTDAALAVTRPLLTLEPVPPPPNPPPADVVVELGTAALRELGAGAPLTMLRLQIAEEGVEVTQVEQGGAITRRLTPE